MDFPVVDVMKNPKKDWGLILKDVHKNKRYAANKLGVDWQTYNNNDYMFTHTSIVASVATDSTNYRILDPCHELVNANGNAWTNEVLPGCFKSFIGGENYLEHLQIKSLSKGKILDAVLRPVTYIGKNGKKQEIFYCDILLATNRIHEQIVSRVKDGSLSTLSMGALANITQCSYCGQKFMGDDRECTHLENNIRGFLKDQNTSKQIYVAELCGSLDHNNNYIEDSCEFIEASWVENPAFKGAVVNHVVSNEEELEYNSNIKKAFEFEDLSQLFNLKVANKNSYIAAKVAMHELRKQKYKGIINNIF